MEKNIKDYLHLYLGCEIEYGAEDDKKTGVMTNVDIFSTYTVNVGLVMVPVQLMKPILRPLSDMTEEEARDCWFASGIINGVTNYKHALNGFHFPDCDIYQMALITNWLRQNGFDCDGLIESGLAIDKNKQPAV